MVGLIGVDGLKDSALEIKESGQRHAQILCQVQMETIVLVTVQKMSLVLVSV